MPLLQKESTDGPLGPPEGNTRAGICHLPSSSRGPFECGTQTCRLPGGQVNILFENAQFEFAILGNSVFIK